MHRVCLFVILGLALLATGTQAESPSAQDLAFLSFLGAPARCTTAALGGGEPVDPGASTDASCTAQCNDTWGSVSLTCADGCTAVDQNCAAGEQGYVQCASGTIKQCGECTPCSATTDCPDGTILYCEGWGNTCEGGQGLAYVWCGDYMEWCPGCEGQDYCD